MRYSLLAVLAILLCVQGGKAEEKPLVDQVERAIDNGKQYLITQQRKTDGSWELYGNLPRGGSTALALLALLNAGVSPESQVIQKGLKYLRTIPTRATYVVGLQTMVFAQAGQGVDRKRIQENVDWLLSARQEQGWGYGKVGARSLKRPDNSNTQYALLGLHAGLEAGAVVPQKDLEAIRKFYIDMQKKEGVDRGGWGYRATTTSSSMTMTTAGVCGLLITGMDLKVSRQKLDWDTGVATACGKYEENKPVAWALQWIGDRFPPELHRETISIISPPYYCLYGLERTGRLSGERFFGGHDWYEIGCRWLVKDQNVNGSWGGPGRRTKSDHWPVIATSFALLFLSKGRTPVLITKLAHGSRTNMDWNNKRSDIRHLVQFASQSLFKKTPLAWQIFDVRNRRLGRDGRRKVAEELLASPIVYVNGHWFRPEDREKKILKHYLENGGFLFAEACCGDRTFDEDFKKVMAELFPREKLRPLPVDHPVWTASGKFAITPDEYPLWGIQQGCKTVVIYSPKPVAGFWEENGFNRGRGKLAFGLGANVIAYATGLQKPPPRGSRFAIPTNTVRDRIKRGYLKVAQLRHEGDWQPAPKAMYRLMTEMRQAGVDTILHTEAIHPKEEALPNYRFLYMHGRYAFSYKEAELTHLRFVLKNGGTLLADACCGSRVFDKSFRQFMRVLWAKENEGRKEADQFQLMPIPQDDVLFSQRLNGKAIQKVRCRRERADDNKEAYPLVDPALEGVKYRGRWVVIYSRYDIGCALQKHKSSSCLGHDYESAVRLGRAAVLYALTP